MWQTLETKARFIQQVMRGHTSVRTAEDLHGGVLTYAEIKAIASGNPVVMEKVKIDTEIRKLDQLRAVHLNQQHGIRWQIRNLPEKIDDATETIEHLHADIATRDAHDGGDFTMTVGNRTFSGKGAREEAGEALARAILSRGDDYAPRLRASFRGFEILSRDEPGAPVPDLFLRGAGTYTAHINADNMQSIEHTLRALDKAVEDERRQIERLEKTVTDYQAQANRPFEHEAHLKELLARRAQINAALDLDKSDAQASEPAGEPTMDCGARSTRADDHTRAGTDFRTAFALSRGCRDINCSQIVLKIDPLREYFLAHPFNSLRTLGKILIAKIW